MMPALLMRTSILSSSCSCSAHALTEDRSERSSATWLTSTAPFSSSSRAMASSAFSCERQAMSTRAPRADSTRAVS